MALTEKEAYQLAARDKVAFARFFFGYDLCEKQQEAVNMRCKTAVKCAGRRFGKSTTSNVDLMHTCYIKPNATAFVVGPSVDQAQIYFDEVERAVTASPMMASIVEDIHHRPFPEIKLFNGSVIHGRSTAYDGKFLRGKGADIVVVTEAAFVTDTVYNEVIRALVLDRGGRIILESTPNGHNYFYNLFRQGMSDPNQYVRSFHATAYDNTRLAPDEIDRIRMEIPDIAFRVEYLAEFVDDDTLVFPWAVLEPVLEDYVPIGMRDPEHRYVIGVDLAKLSDYTVVTVLDCGVPGGRPEPMRVAEWYRMQSMSYQDVAHLINNLQDKYKARVFLDATGVGEAVQEQVNNVEPIVFTQKSREDLISRLVVTVEQKTIRLPLGASFRQLIDELRFFQRQKHGQGIRAEAPPGLYDDAVFSLALAVWGATEDPYRGLREYYDRMRQEANQASSRSERQGA